MEKFEATGEFLDDLGEGIAETFLSKLKVGLVNDDIEFIKNYILKDATRKPVIIGIESVRKDKRYEHLREEGEQENTVELSLDEVKNLRDYLNKLIEKLED
jgi:hypothetical protein